MKNHHRSKDTTATTLISVWEEGFLYIIGVDGFSKQWGFFCIRSFPSLIAWKRHEDGQYILAVWPGCHQMHSNSQQKQYMEGSTKHEEDKHKTSSTGKVKDGREKNTTINWKMVTYNVDVPRSKSLSMN